MGAATMEIRLGDEWYFGNYRDGMECVIDFGDDILAVLAGCDREYARRIVAAVNATSDLPIEALEADVVRKLVEAARKLALFHQSGGHEGDGSDATVNAVMNYTDLAKGEAA